MGEQSIGGQQGHGRRAPEIFEFDREEAKEEIRMHPLVERIGLPAEGLAGDASAAAVRRSGLA